MISHQVADSHIATLRRFAERLVPSWQNSDARIAFVVVALLLAPAAAQAIQIQFDFNDNTAGQLAGQGGGTGTGGVWTNNTNHDVVAGDLVANPSTNFALTQSAGTPQSVSNEGAAFGVANIARSLDTALGGTVWFSYLADYDQPATRLGIGFNNTGFGTSNPRLLMIDNGLRFIGTGIDITAGGLGLDAAGTQLVLGRIDLDGEGGSNDRLQVWLDPDVSGGLGLPTLDTGFASNSLGGSLSSVNLQIYQGTADARIDFLTLSDGPNAFMDVTGVAPLLQATWVATGSGDWGVGTNWDTGSPPDGLATLFGNAITGPATVTLDQDRSATDVTFDNSNSYTVTANTLTVTQDISALQGSHTISSDVQFAAGTRTLTSSTGANLAVTGTTTFASDGAGTIVLDGAGDGSIGAIRDNNDLGNVNDGTDNVAVIKRGAGTWTIGNGSTVAEDFHGGNTTVEQGTLIVNQGGGDTGELRSPTIAVNAGGTLDTSQFGTYSLTVGQALSGGGTIDTGGSNNLQIFSDNVVTPGDSVGTLNITGNLRLNGVEGSSPSGGFVFELSPSTASGNDQVAVTGNLVSNAGSGDTGITIIPTGSSLASGTYELITFGGTHTGSASDFALDDSIQTRFTQAITADSDSINLEITGSNAGLVWRGNDGANPTFWDVNTTSNWDNGGASDVFFDLDAVTFDDTAVGNTVEIQSTVTPASVTFNNSSQDFTVAGSGAISGAGGVTKSGTGRVTISTPQAYAGTTTITGGVLHAADNGALGSTDGGTAVNGGALDITGSNIAGETVSIEGAGSDGRGALLTDGLDALGGGEQQISDVVQTGDATIGAYSDAVEPVFQANDYRWDLEPGGSVSSASWQGNGHNLTKRGRGTVSIQGTGDMNVASINIEQGVLFWQGSTTATGATVTIGNNVDPFVDPDVATGGASLSTFYSGSTAGDPPAMHTVDIVMQGGQFNHATSVGTNFVLDGSLVQNDVTGDRAIDNEIGSTSFNDQAGTLFITQGISGTGDVRFFGNGTVELQGDNTYTGNTEVTGTVALSGSGQLSGTSRIELSGAIDASGRTDGTFALGSGQTLNVGGEATSSEGAVTVQLTPSQDRRLRYNPNATQDAAGIQPAGQLFVGTISTSTGPNGNNDLTRSVLEFDLTSELALTGVTDIDSVTLTLDKNSVDGGSVAGDVNLEVHELLDMFVSSETNAAFASSGTPWTGYTLDGDVDPCAGAECALGALVSTGVGDPSNGDDVVFTDNQGGAFETLVESALAGSGSVRIRVNADSAAEAAAVRALFRFGDSASGDASVLEIGFNGVTVDTTTATITGDFDMDANSTLELDVFNDVFTDLLDISGAADLNGVLDANLISGSTLAVNDMITVLTAAGGIIDSGLSVTGPFTHSIIGNDLVLTFTGLVGLAGDFNADGVVDAADYTVWRDNLGAGDESALNGNGDGMNGVDVADYALWRTNFGNTSAVAAASNIPEPTACVALLIGLAMTGGAARRRLRRDEYEQVG